MTPKEKAIELVDKYRIVLIQSDTDAGEEILCTIIAKQCALVAVDEIINSIIITDLTAAENQFVYWEQVKKQIEGL